MFSYFLASQKNEKILNIFCLFEKYNAYLG